jgi:cytochrome c peroxidase
MRKWIFYLVMLVAIGLSVAKLVAEESVPKLGPLGLPPVPADNLQTPEKVELGKMLYFDPRLSGDVSIACSDCHSPQMGWTDGSDLCRGYPGTVHWRNCQSIVNSAYYQKLFWAGSSLSLESQAESAAKGAVAGNGEADMMEERLRQIPEYVRRFKKVFGTDWPELKDAWRAIASFERTLVQRDTPFDRYMRGEKDALTEKAKKGLELFQGKAGCIQCHNGSFFTDEKYYNLGVPESYLFSEDPLRQITFRYEQYAKGVTEDLYRKTKIDLGLYYRMKRDEDMGKFRTPTLRYLVYTPPYMHNGFFFTLEEVIDFYNEGGGEDLIKKSFGHSTKTNILKPLNLSKVEKEALLAFLESLSGEEIVLEPPVLPEYAVME